MKKTLLVFLLLAAAIPLAAERPETPADPAAALKNLPWRSIGPANVGGRVSVIAGVPGDPFVFYVAGANGGIFKTTNGGTTFKPIFDDQPLLSIGAIAIAPSNPDVLYVGTGEGNPRNNASFGDGVYRSVDGGEHWTHVGLEDTDRIARIAIDPHNPDVAYVAALGHEWGANEQRGLFKTSDGGKTWQKVLYKNAQTGCSDVDIDPGNANIVYAGMYTFLRKAWHFDSGGGETALYKSVDGGATWRKLTNGLPKGPMDRIGIAVARSNPAIVYVVSETKDEGELWRSDDAGETWKMANKDPNINFRPFYYSDIRVDPRDPNRLYSLSGSLYLSDDGGKTFQRIATDVHGDHQALWIDPLNANRVLSGSDGGFQVSYDRAKTFEIVNTIAFTQFYHIAYDLRQPYFVCGGLQDNGTWCGPSATLYGEGIRKDDWYTVGGGDGFFAVPDVGQPNLIYANSQGGNIVLTDIRAGSERSIHPDPNRIGSAGDAIAAHKYRFNWNSPIVLAPQDPKTVYFGGNVVFKTTNRGQSWEVISPDLTTNDKSKQQSSGGAVVVDNTAAEFHCTILTIAPSPVDPNVIWAGTDDGNVQITRDAGKTWTNVVKNIPGLAPNAWVSTIEASPSDAGTAYVASDHHQENDYAPYAFETTDYGRTWKRISGDLPAKGWAHVVREDPKNRNLLYAGTEVGVFASWDGGAHWVSIRNNVPAVPVRDILVHPRDNDLILATHGRGAYILDDATPLQRIAEATTTDAHLFDVRPAVRYTIWNKDGNLGQKTYRASNPPYGAMIDYYLKTEPKEDVTIVIADRGGKAIREIRRAPKLAGVNRTAWDLRHDGPRGFGQQTGEAAPRFGFGGGPFVVPGEYTVKVKAAGRELTKAVQVAMDPRVQISTADLQAQLDAALALRDLTSKVNAIIERGDDLVKQLSTLADRLKKGEGRTLTSAGAGGHDGAPEPPDSSAATANEVAAVLDELKALRNDKLTRPIQGLGYRQYPRLREELTSLGSAVARAVAPPTDSQTRRLQELTSETAAVVDQMNTIVSTKIARINELMKTSPYIATGEPIR